MLLFVFLDPCFSSYWELLFFLFDSFSTVRLYIEEDYIELCNENFSDDDLQLKLENPTKYYLENIDDAEIMNELKWEDPDLYLHILRLNFINKITDHEPIYRCPECRSNIITDEWGEEYCSNCGLVTRTHYQYVAGQSIVLPFGLK